MINVSMDLPSSMQGDVASLFQEEGFSDVSWTAPVAKSIGDASQVVHVVYHLATDAVAGLIGAGAVAAVNRVIARIRAGGTPIEPTIEQDDVPTEQ